MYNKNEINLERQLFRYMKFRSLKIILNLVLSVPFSKEQITFSSSIQKRVELVT